jgi:hypothetical protein
LTDAIQQSAAIVSADLMADKIFPDKRMGQLNKKMPIMLSFF